MIARIVRDRCGRGDRIWVFADGKQRNTDAAAASVPGLAGIRFIDVDSLRARLFR